MDPVARFVNRISLDRQGRRFGPSINRLLTLVCYRLVISLEVRRLIFEWAAIRVSFICTVSDIDPDLRYARRWLAASVLAHIGYDGEAALNFWLMVGLDICPGIGAEFYFNILQVSRRDNVEETLWDARQVRTIIGKPDRARIRSLLMRAAARLIEVSRPAQFVLTTRDADLPPRALEKYFQLCHVFSRTGYLQLRADAYHGRHFWCFDRATPENVEIGQFPGYFSITEKD